MIRVEHQQECIIKKVMDLSPLLLSSLCDNRWRNSLYFLVRTMSSDSLNTPEAAVPSIPPRDKSLRQRFVSSGSKIDLYGRADKQAALLTAYQQATSDRTTTPTTSKHHQTLVLIEGEPGTGKTSLAHSLRAPVRRDAGFFVTGKFPPLLQGEPYGVFVTALTDYTDKIFASRHGRTGQVQERLRKAISRPEDQELLRSIIPALDQVLGGSSSGTDRDNKAIEENNVFPQEAHSNSTSTKKHTRSLSPRHDKKQPPTSHALHRFHFLVCTYIHTLLAGDGGPLVLFLDDLHWADTASLELLRALCEWNSDSPLLLLGAHRHVTPDDTRPFAVALASIQARADHDQTTTASTSSTQHQQLHHHHQQYTWPTIEFQHIPLDNLDRMHVQELICSVLELKNTTPEDTHMASLADVVYERTEGNAFYVLNFLTFLEDQGFLVQNPETLLWTWEDNAIRDSLDSKDTVVDLIAKKIQSELDDDEQVVLKVAACMGKELDDSALTLVMGKTSSSNTSASALVPRALERAEKAGFLVFVPHAGGYQFVHDHVQHAAFSLIPEHARAAFQWDIGRKLWKVSSDQALEANIFVVVNLLHGALGAGTVPLNMSMRYSVAELHWTAGERAVAMSAFPDAALYHTRGIQWLPDTSWDARYGLSLALHTAAAEVEMCNGNFDHVKELIGTVFQQATSLVDKFSCYMTFIACMGQQGNIQEAQRVAFEVLRGLGERFPRRATKKAIAREFFRTKWATRGRSDRDFLQLPVMTDPTKLSVGRVMALLFRYLYMARSPYAPLVTFRMIRLCLKYGRFNGSALAFAQYAIVVGSVMGDIDTGCRYGRLAISLLESEPRKIFWLPQVYLVYCGFIAHFVAPLRDTLDDLKFASRSALETGNRESSIMNGFMYCENLYYSGGSLDSLEEEVSTLAQCMSLYKQENMLLLMAPLQQLLENLKGNSKNPAILRGSLFDRDRALKDSNIHGVEGVMVFWLYLAVEVAYLFRDFHQASELCEQFRRSKQDPPADFGFTKLLVTESLTIMAMARLAKYDVHKAVKHVKQSIKKVDKWASYSPENFGFRKTLLEAELASLEGQMDTRGVVALYREAIDIAKHEGFINDAAVACERAGDHLLRSDAATEEIMEYYWESCELYSEWGAPAKAHQVKKRLISK